MALLRQPARDVILRPGPHFGHSVAAHGPAGCGRAVAVSSGRLCFCRRADVLCRNDGGLGQARVRQTTQDTAVGSIHGDCRLPGFGLVAVQERMQHAPHPHTRSCLRTGDVRRHVVWPSADKTRQNDSAISANGIYLLQGPIFFLVFASASVRSFATESAWSYWTVVIIAALALTIVATATHVLIERPGIRAGQWALRNDRIIWPMPSFQGGSTTGSNPAARTAATMDSAWPESRLSKLNSRLADLAGRLLDSRR
jgi:hypothetical protein